MKATIARFNQWLQEPIAPQVLAITRIGFGIFMAIEMIYYLSIRLVHNMFVLPAINFKYDFLYWVQPLPEPLLNGLIWLLLVLAVFISAGFFFTWSCRIFAFGYAYLFLLDKSLYNNHIYLFILLALLLSFTDAHTCWGVGSIKRQTQKTIQRWQVFMLQAQLVIVYFYGGIAKLTYDWLVRCEPIRSLVTSLPDENVLSGILKNDIGVLILNYGGVLLDILAPFLLWYKPVRNYGVILLICFHGMNSILFNDIGIFPFIMLFSLLLFYDVSELPLLKNLLTGKSNQPDAAFSVRHRAVSKTTAGPWLFLKVYFVIQLLLPLRGHFLPNQLDWTTIGNRFSWRMKVDTRQVESLAFIVRDPVTMTNYPVDVRLLINDVQLLNLIADPRSIRDFSDTMAARAAQNGVRNGQVFGDLQVRYNGRPPQPFIDKDVDLTKTDYRFYRKLTWVYPLVKQDKN